MSGVNAIVSAGSRVIAVEGFVGGASLREELIFLRARSLTYLSGPFHDNTFLGVIGDRAYIDDWCCNGRPDVYRPATIFSISLADGSAGPSTDLAPEQELHSKEHTPLGQGEHNYMIGRYFYVVVDAITYRYDLVNLQAAPMRLATPVLRRSCIIGRHRMA